MEPSDLNTSKLTHDDIVYLENVMIDIRSYINILHTTENKRRILLFPPINNFRRFLIHQLVENTFREEHLTTLSVGSLSSRRTVVYPSSVKPMDDKSSNATVTQKNNIKKKLVNVQLYRPPSLRKQVPGNPSRNIEKKTRKPDIQLYVPRGRRVFVSQDVTKENIRDSSESSGGCIDEPVSEPIKRASIDLTIIPKQENFSECKLKAEESDTNVRDTTDADSELIAEIPNKKLKDNNYVTTKQVLIGTESKNTRSVPANNLNSVNVTDKFVAKTVVSDIKTCNLENCGVISIIDLPCDTDSNISEQKENISSAIMNKRKSEKNISANTTYTCEVTEDDIGFFKTKSAEKYETSEKDSLKVKNVEKEYLKNSVDTCEIIEDDVEILKNVSAEKHELSENDALNARRIFKNSTDTREITEKDVGFLENVSVEKQLTNENDLLKAGRKEKGFFKHSTDTREITEDDIGFFANLLVEEPVLRGEDSLKARRMEKCSIEDDANAKDASRKSVDFTSNVCEGRKLSAESSTKCAPNEKKPSLNVNDCDWEELFDEDGEYVDKSLLNELMTAVGKVTIQRAAQDYTPFQSADERTSDGGCIIEIYGFPAEFKTEELLSAFTPYRNDSGFQIVWVDDTHALAIFSSPMIADEVLNTELPFIKTRPLKNAIPKSRMKARDHVLPPASRPKTCVSLARRLVSGHLGMKINVTDKQKEAEKKLLSDAREKKRLVARQKLETWEGTSTCGKYT